MNKKSIKKMIKDLLGPPVQRMGYYSGLMALTSFHRGTGGAVILMYHSVAGKELSGWIDPANHVPADVFDLQMEYLSKNYNVISLSELLLMIKEGQNPPGGTVVITFDDGYLDNLTVAAPILDKYKLKATLFLASGYIDRGETQWIDQIYSIFKFRTRNSLYWEHHCDKEFYLEDNTQFLSIYKNICNDMISAGKEKRNEIIASLSEKLRPDVMPPRLTLTWKDVCTLISDYKCFELGCHTVEHTDLTAVNLKEAESELLLSSNKIEKETGAEIKHFSFCYGRTSKELRGIVFNAGYNLACGGDGLDPVIRAGADMFRFPRVAAPETMSKFKIEVDYKNSGFWRKIAR